MFHHKSAGAPSKIVASCVRRLFPLESPRCSAVNFGVNSTSGMRSIRYITAAWLRTTGRTLRLLTWTETNP